MRWLHHLFYVFSDADSESDVESFEYEKIDRRDHLKFSKLEWGTKTPEFENFNKNVPYRLQMTREFQI